MSLFGDLDIASAEDNPFDIPDNTYETYLTDVEVKRSKAGNLGLALGYKIASGAHEGKSISEWKNIPEPEDPANPSPKDLQAMSFLKSRLIDLGVPEERINSLEPKDLIGTHVYVTTKKNGEYTNVRSVKLADVDPTDYDIDRVPPAKTANVFQD